MKKVLLAGVVIAALGGLAWLVGSKPAKHGQEETEVETAVAVHVGTITRTTLRRYVTAYGTVEPAPAGAQPAAGARVAPSVAGVVKAVHCTEGQRVEKGTVLFQLDRRVADVAIEKARETVKFAEENFARQKKLIRAEGTSQKLLLEAEQALTVARNDLVAAQTQEALLRVEAPLSGTVVRVNVKPGEAVDLTTTMAELVDLDHLVASAGVPSVELAALKVGQSADVMADSSAAPVGGSVSSVSPQVDAKTGTALVRVSLPARSGLRPGQFVTLRIVSEERRDCLAVPVASVVKDGAGETVIALVHDGTAVQKPVKAGLRDAGLVEIEAEGLQADMPVVTEGAYALPKETKIRVLGR